MKLILLALALSACDVPSRPKFKVTFKNGSQFTVCGRGVVRDDCIHFQDGSGGCGEFIVEQIGTCE